MINKLQDFLHFCAAFIIFHVKILLIQKMVVTQKRWWSRIFFRKAEVEISENRHYGRDPLQ